MSFLDSYDFEAHKGDRRAEVTLCLANPPARAKDEAKDFLNRLLNAAGPDGWRWSVLQIVDPDEHEPPENGEQVVAALDKLIAEAKRVREEVTSYERVYANDVDTWQLSRLSDEVENAIDALPDEDDESE
jgi:hypothetical protein